MSPCCTMGGLGPDLVTSAFMYHDLSPQRMVTRRGPVGLGAAVGAVVLVLGACGQILGIDPTDPDGTNPDSAIFAVDAVYIGATLSTVPVELSPKVLKAWAVDEASTGGFRELSVTFVGTTARCELPRGKEGLWQLTMPTRFGDFPRLFPITETTRQWHTVVTTPGNPEVAPPPADAIVDVSTKLTMASQPSDHFNLIISGTWANFRFVDEKDGSTTFDPVAVPYSLTTPLAETPLYTITRNDRAYVTRHRLPSLISVAKIARFDLTAGVNLLSAPQIAVAIDRTLNATLSTEEVRSRLAPQITAGATLAEEYWRLVASPNGSYAFYWAPLLTAGTAAPTVQASYGNPFADDGLSPTLFWVTSTSRVERDADGTGWTHRAGFQLEDTAPSGNRAYVADSGLPASISLNGLVLNSDKIPVSAGSGRPFEFSFVSDRPDGELRSMDCYRFDFKPVRETQVLSMRMISDQIRIPRTMLPAGARYKCRMHLTRGVPKALQGDDREREPTIRSGFLDSSSFIVR